jgi:hypothetical protein
LGICETRERSYEELAHVIMETKNAHCLPAVIQRPRRAGGVSQSEAKGLRTVWGTADEAWSLKQEPEAPMRQYRRRWIQTILNF